MKTLTMHREKLQPNHYDNFNEGPGANPTNSRVTTPPVAEKYFSSAFFLLTTTLCFVVNSEAVGLAPGLNYISEETEFFFAK
jgi:hypothetical protein